jgi:hypothetical protein
MKDLYNNILPVQLLAPVDKSTDTATPWYSKYVDLQGFEGCVIEVSVGVVTGGSSTDMLTFTIQEASTAPTTPASASSYAAAATTDLQGSFSVVYTGNNNATLQRVGYKGSQRYICVKCVGTSTAGISADLISITAILGIAAERPIIASPTTGSVS